MTTTRIMLCAQNTTFGLVCVLRTYFYTTYRKCRKTVKARLKKFWFKFHVLDDSLDDHRSPSQSGKSIHLHIDNNDDAIISRTHAQDSLTYLLCACVYILCVQISTDPVNADSPIYDCLVCQTNLTFCYIIIIMDMAIPQFFRFSQFLGIKSVGSPILWYKLHSDQVSKWKVLVLDFRVAHVCIFRFLNKISIRFRSFEP